MSKEPHSWKSLSRDNLLWGWLSDWNDDGSYAVALAFLLLGQVTMVVNFLCVIFLLVAIPSTSLLAQDSLHAGSGNLAGQKMELVRRREENPRLHRVKDVSNQLEAEQRAFFDKMILESCGNNKYDLDDLVSRVLYLYELENQILPALKNSPLKPDAAELLNLLVGKPSALLDLSKTIPKDMWGESFTQKFKSYHPEFVKNELAPIDWERVTSWVQGSVIEEYLKFQLKTFCMKMKGGNRFRPTTLNWGAETPWPMIADRFGAAFYQEVPLAKFQESATSLNHLIYENDDYVRQLESLQDLDAKLGRSKVETILKKSRVPLSTFMRFTLDRPLDDFEMNKIVDGFGSHLQMEWSSSPQLIVLMTKVLGKLIEKNIPPEKQKLIPRDPLLILLFSKRVALSADTLSRLAALVSDEAVDLVDDLLSQNHPIDQPYFLGIVEMHRRGLPANDLARLIAASSNGKKITLNPNLADEMRLALDEKKFNEVFERNDRGMFDAKKEDLLKVLTLPGVKRRISWHSFKTFQSTFRE